MEVVDEAACLRGAFCRRARGVDPIRKVLKKSCCGSVSQLVLIVHYLLSGNVDHG